MPQILTNQDAPLALSTYTNGTLTDQGTFTIGVVDGNGDTVVSSGTAVTDNGDGTYSYTLSALTDVDVLTATWTESAGAPVYKTQYDVVGGFLFDENRARTWGAADNSTNIPLASGSKYTDATLAAERERIHDDLESWTARSWIPRYCRVEISGDGYPVLHTVDGVSRLASGVILNRPGRIRDITKLLSVTIDGTAQTLTNFTTDPARGAIIHKTGVFPRSTRTLPFNIVIEYEYGMAVPVDGADRVALDLLVDRLVPSAFPGRALSVNTDFGSMRLVTEGGPLKNRTRLPHVNQWIADHDCRIPLG